MKAVTFFIALVINASFMLTLAATAASAEGEKILMIGSVLMIVITVLVHFFHLNLYKIRISFLLFFSFLFPILVIMYPGLFPEVLFVLIGSVFVILSQYIINADLRLLYNQSLFVSAITAIVPATLEYTLLPHNVNYSALTFYFASAFLTYAAFRGRRAQDNNFQHRRVLLKFLAGGLGLVMFSVALNTGLLMDEKFRMSQKYPINMAMSYFANGFGSLFLVAALSSNQYKKRKSKHKPNSDHKN